MYGYPGGNGGNGGDGFGGVNGTALLTNCTLAFNAGTAGGGGGGGPGGYGYIIPGPHGTSGPSGTAYGATTDVALPNTLIASNSPAGSETFVDPRLGPLADNGGPTLTMALLPGSPAIDAGNTAIAPITDQRGYLRPAGAAADIGAFEFGALSLLPSITRPPLTQTAEVGATVLFYVRVTSSMPESTRYQWYFSGTNALSGATNSHLYLTNVQSVQAGSYAVVVTNLGGAVTSPPAMLSVIAIVPRRMVPALTLVGRMWSFLNLDYRTTPDPSANWETFDTVQMTPSQMYFDVAAPLGPQRFYRAWQTNVLSPPSVRDVHLVPGITLTGAINTSVRIDYLNQFGPIDAWVTNLATVALTNTSQLYFDISTIGQPQRLYRLVPRP